jgi:hypothetical protein
MTPTLSPPSPFSVRVLCAGSIDLVPLPDSSATLLTAHNFSLYHCPAVPGLSLSHFLYSAVALFQSGFLSPKHLLLNIHLLVQSKLRGQCRDMDPGFDAILINPWILDSFFLGPDPQPIFESLVTIFLG